MGKLGILGGTSLLKSEIFSSLEPQTISTEHGEVVLYTDPSGTSPIVFIQRHHADGTSPKTYYPPHKINHRANLAALQSQNVTKIVAICSVGSLTPSITIGTLVSPDDYFHLFGPVVSYHSDARAHIVPGIDQPLRQTILSTLRAHNLPLHAGPATYVQTTGPRFETRAEVRFLGGLGDVIGMTGASEATMARELGLPYAMLAMVDNMANGLTGGELTEEEFRASVARNVGKVETAVQGVLAALAV